MCLDVLLCGSCTDSIPCFHREYELDLRGNKIGVIENLAVTQNQFDCIGEASQSNFHVSQTPMRPTTSRSSVDSHFCV